MRTRLLCGALACLFVCAGVALGNTKKIKDDDDTVGPIDIKSASAGHTRSGKLKHVVVFYEDVPADGETGNEYLQIWKKKPHVLPGCGGCFEEAPYKMQGPQRGKRDVFKGGEAGDPYEKTGTGKIKRKGKKLTFILPLKAIGKPKHKYYWRIVSNYYGPPSECPTLDPCTDFAPNASKVVKHKLD